MKKRRGRKSKLFEFTRDLTKSEFKALEFICRWKVAPGSLLKEIIFKSMSPWTFYKTMRRLKKEKILTEIPSGKYFSHCLWSLTEFGFEIYLRDLDYTYRQTFKVHSPKNAKCVSF